MNKQELLSRIDHTQLKAFATLDDVFQLCDEAIENSTASVCIPPYFVKPVKDKYQEKLKICTVIGFPLGYQTTEAKVAETKQAIIDGADEIDMVINVAALKSKDNAMVLTDIKAVRAASVGKILKVIIETCYLDETEKIACCHMINEAGADYIKTSTGFGTSGADLKDIELFKKYIDPEVKIKAAGGIRTLEDIVAYVEAGCDRIGASSAVVEINGRM